VPAQSPYLIYARSPFKFCARSPAGCHTTSLTACTIDRLMFHSFLPLDCVLPFLFAHPWLSVSFRLSAACNSSRCSVRSLFPSVGSRPYESPLLSLVLCRRQWLSIRLALWFVHFSTRRWVTVRLARRLACPLARQQLARQLARQLAFCLARRLLLDV
jgi:hypothetical protein